MKEFEKAVKRYIRDIIIPNLPKASYDLILSTTMTMEITRADGSHKIEQDNAVIPMNVPNIDRKVADAKKKESK